MIPFEIFVTVIALMLCIIGYFFYNEDQIHGYMYSGFLVAWIGSVISTVGLETQSIDVAFQSNEIGTLVSVFSLLILAIGFMEIVHFIQDIENIQGIDIIGGVCDFFLSMIAFFLFSSMVDIQYTNLIGSAFSFICVLSTLYVMTISLSSQVTRFFN